MEIRDAVAADTAMQYGVTAPRGPRAWADEIGPDQVLTVLDTLAQGYGEDRYRASPLLRRLVAGGRRLFKARRLLHPGRFHPMLRTTPTALEMLPEIPDTADHGRGEPARN